MRRSGLSIAGAALLVWGLPCLASERLPMPVGPVLLTVSGLIDRTNEQGQARFDQTMLEELGRATLETRSVWADGKQVYEGVPLQAVLDRVGARGTVIRATAANSYEVGIPSADLQYGPLIAMRLDGRALTLRDKGPLWIVYPRDAYKVLQDQRYDSRWIWNLTRLHVE